MRRRLFWIALAGILGVLASSCSPFYVVQAGWEEAQILWRREKIAELVERPDTDEKLREKLKLVLQARDYAEELGLKPEGSFTQYSKVDRDVLLWVLSASSKVALRPATWWFPIVGSIPYKGFFDKEDAEEEQKTLEAKDYDTFMRPSAAFSTLGWFDDPLLSTTAKYDELSLANTVIHEILHNTVWVKDHAAFNESLANFVGSIGAVEFFKKIDAPSTTRADESMKRWKDDLEFARFLDETVASLQPIYIPDTEPLPEVADPRYKDIVGKREEILQAAIERWQKSRGVAPAKKRAVLNNAVIIAYQIYLKQPQLFQDLYDARGGSLPVFIEEMKKLADELKKSKEDPYVALARRITEIRSEKTASP